MGPVMSSVHFAKQFITANYNFKSITQVCHGKMIYHMRYPSSSWLYVAFLQISTNQRQPQRDMLSPVFLTEAQKGMATMRMCIRGLTAWPQKESKRPPMTSLSISNESITQSRSPATTHQELRLTRLSPGHHSSFLQYLEVTHLRPIG